MSKIELLSPAGDFRSLNSAIKAGADAVYFGLKEFNMRDSAKNFSIK
ncbi:MAG: U32 family peptidase, partial [Nanoarchaeota archaeon]